MIELFPKCNFCLSLLPVTIRNGVPSELLLAKETLVCSKLNIMVENYYSTLIFPNIENQGSDQSIQKLYFLVLLNHRCKL